ncbi:MAG: hypothetical protein KJ731_01810 [Alphaproteobacteria bacterium]|nr:hypothetical protein [Alphaproteobacteria bacterium]MBU1280274.1 hypothetical protein [Alphaproteobacteria bacterium]MBU1573013.1 hypothetical protein [Alphaproteobacteria bacterium]MBU1827204.1 hypothetical protein [Alphaproteobacteria bacterium]MBU2079972.1 hypothetical protein [Alphaproteobacteria bacterium]
MQISSVVRSGSYLGLKVGDVIEDVANDRVLFRPGLKRWYALLCRPQHEIQAERWLASRGVYAFHPVTRRRSKVRGVVREYDRRYLPGYVFARFGGDPICHKVIDSPFLFGALSMANGEWGVLGPKRLASLHEMRIRDERREADRAESARRALQARRVRVGVEAMFRAGPFAGHHCEVVEITAHGGIKVRFKMFSHDALVEAHGRDLVGLGHKGA